jgi:2,3-bisphosphoglycerate-independent phosphoglycerate mutase
MTAYLSWTYRKLCAEDFNLARKKSGRLPLNALITQRAGRLKQVVPFSRKNGIRGLSVSSGVVYTGLGTYLGLDVIRGLEHDHPGEEIRARIKTACNYLDKYDFFHVHSKVPDEAGHKKDPLLKKQAIELLDKGLADSLPELMDDREVIVAVTADHSTPSAGPLVHSGEPVPLVIAGEGVRVDKVRKFDEVSAAGGGLGFVRGREFMYLVLNCLERSKLVGLMDEPEDHPYWPGNGEPFVLE